MRVFKPQRNRIALDVSTIEDVEVRGVLEQLALLQQDTNEMNNGLAAKVQVAEQELQNMLNRMKTANEELDDLISSIKTQVSSLVDAGVKYTQATQSGLVEENPKFRASFIYLMKDAVTNLKQVVDGLQEQAEGIIVKEVPQQTEGFEISEEAVVSPEMTPEPTDVVKTSSIKTAAVYEIIMQSIEKLKPIVESAKNITIKNKELMGELQEVMGSVAQVSAPELEETEAFNPEGGPAELQEVDAGIPEEEVDQAMGVEFEEPETEEVPTPEEESIEEAEAEAGGEEAEEDIAENEPPVEDEEIIEEEVPEETTEEGGGEPAEESEEKPAEKEE